MKMQDPEATDGEKELMQAASGGKPSYGEAVGGGAVARSPWEPTTVRTESPEADAKHSATLRDRRKRVKWQIPIWGFLQA